MKTFEQLMNEVEDHFNNISDEEFKRKLEECKNDPLTKLLEHLFCCNECLNKNIECKSCMLKGEENEIQERLHNE